MRSALLEIDFWPMQGGRASRTGLEKGDQSHRSFELSLKLGFGHESSTTWLWMSFAFCTS
jgi:hypothetical protein